MKYKYHLRDTTSPRKLEKLWWGDTTAYYKYGSQSTKNSQNFLAKKVRKSGLRGLCLLNKCKNKYLLFLESTGYILGIFSCFFSVNRRIGPPNPFCLVVVWYHFTLWAINNQRPTHFTSIIVTHTQAPPAEFTVLKGETLNIFFVHKNSAGLFGSSFYYAETE